VADGATQAERSDPDFSSWRSWRGEVEPSRIAGKNDSHPVLTMRNGLASVETLL
jgi:hypothetical protein